MNDLNFGERLDTSAVIERHDPVITSQAVSSDAFTDRYPVDPALIHETPMGGSVAPIGPLVGTPLYTAPVVETIPYTPPVVESISPAVPATPAVGGLAALLTREESGHFRTRWNEIQGQFVDEPRSAVQQADALVSEVSAQITQMFAHEHTTLEAQWNQGNDVSTEDLRKALQRYRSFFNRLVV
jgi:hypothetical protein